MNKYRITWNRQGWGNIIIQAHTPNEAQEKFEQGDYSYSDLDIKDETMELSEIEEIN